MADQDRTPTSSESAPAAPDGAAGQGNPAKDPSAKDPSDWVTGDEPMTGPQASYLQTLAREAGEDVEEDLTKAEASEQIDRLQQQTGRGA